LFGLWVDCRLPTEAEWEYACGAGGDAEWCCADEKDLPRYAWYSENSDGEIRTVASREPNALGLHDMHGNVWEWCHDAWDQDAFDRGRCADPVVDAAVHDDDPAGGADRVSRGGSALSLAEMCRTRFRYHDPPDYWAADLGFRLARTVPTGEVKT
jgi:sulfatase modifying factor 1